MGYQTDFYGQFDCHPPLTAEHQKILDDFSEHRHDDNLPDAPGVWCQWIPCDEGAGIEWDGVEKFYNYIEWLDYLIDHFLKPWGYVLNGEVEWQGEERNDLGRIVVRDNAVVVKCGKVVYE